MVQNTPSDLILMAGQSNMAGHQVDADDLAETERGLIEGARIWADGAWVPLGVDAGYQKRGFGPELSFARQWQAQTRRPLSIVKLAKGGSYLSRGWSAEGRGGPLYQRLVAEARAAMATGPMRLRGLLWMQGESDALDHEDAQAYGARFEGFVARLRQDLGVP
ncbi:MAG: sialate O-acetylesterase, partial [Alphaproteobacteria bacterium]|nr:sialate O-acetylesterase [Alphaproteobacteria bacterium]